MLSLQSDQSMTTQGHPFGTSLRCRFRCPGRKRLRGAPSSCRRLRRRTSKRRSRPTARSSPPEAAGGCGRPLPKRRDSEHPGRTRRCGLRARRRSRACRAAAGSARHFRLAGAAPIGSRNGQQQPRQHGPHGVSRLALDFAGRGHAAHRSSRGEPGSADAQQRHTQSRARPETLGARLCLAAIRGRAGDARAKTINRLEYG